MTELPTTDERPDRCETCRFWEVETDDDYQPTKSNAGYCHRGLRHMPVGNATGHPADLWLWPMHYSSDWCGEWQAKGASQTTTLPANLPPWEQFLDSLPSHLKGALDGSWRDGLTLRSWDELLAMPGSHLLERHGFGVVSMRKLAEAVARAGVPVPYSWLNW